MIVMFPTEFQKQKKQKQQQQKHDRFYARVPDRCSGYCIVKKSSAFKEIEQIVRKVAENIKSLKTNREKNLTTLTEKEEKIEVLQDSIVSINKYVSELHTFLA